MTMKDLKKYDLYDRSDKSDSVTVLGIINASTSKDHESRKLDWPTSGLKGKSSSEKWLTQQI